MEVKAYTRYLRMAPRKVRLVADMIRGKNAIRAVALLEFVQKASALPVLKLLRSAIANAEHNFKLHKENLYIKKISVDGGPTLKRWRARAFGRAAMIKKRMSHITLVLDQKSEIQNPKSETK